MAWGASEVMIKAMKDDDRSRFCLAVCGLGVAVAYGILDSVEWNKAWKRWNGDSSK